MLLQKEVIENLFYRLTHDKTAAIEIGGTTVTIRLIGHSASAFCFSTVIYNGDNYIPKSVRACAGQRAPFAFKEAKGVVSIDEKRCNIYLSYIGSFDHLNSRTLNPLLEQFAWVAEEWRHLLDEQDRNDLVYVRV